MPWCCWCGNAVVLLVLQVGTDIEDNKCSWLICTALQLASEEQKEVIKVEGRGGGRGGTLWWVGGVGARGAGGGAGQVRGRRWTGACGRWGRRQGHVRACACVRAWVCVFVWLGRRAAAGGFGALCVLPCIPCSAPPAAGSQASTKGAWRGMACGPGPGPDRARPPRHAPAVGLSSHAAYATGTLHAPHLPHACQTHLAAPSSTPEHTFAIPTTIRAMQERSRQYLRPHTHTPAPAPVPVRGLAWLGLACRPTTGRRARLTLRPSR